MPKAYWIARVDVKDPEAYKAYVNGAAPAFQQYGAVFLARGGRALAMEGAARSRNVVIEFPSMEAAEACFKSDIYQAARQHRVAVAEAEIVIVEGL
jgi:uncharacterized protein (DUF1330 family)